VRVALDVSQAWFEELPEGRTEDVARAATLRLQLTY
jgi:hypothetical protein